MMSKGLLAFIFSFVLVNLASAQSYTANPHLDLRITGMLLPADTPKREDLPLVDISVQNKPLLLRLGQVEDVTERDKSQVNKTDVLFHQVRFTGGAELMERLLRPETIGKVVTIEGWLNTSTRLFQVTGVTVKEAVGGSAK
ncbi:MAG: hypothetical protein HY235_19375 [Acidobacteria bacterium]|nr:hypothetical protein [Acidobacteriota bacterium]